MTEAPRAAAVALRTHAFGIELECSFDAPGLDPSSPSTPLPRTTVELQDAAEIEAQWLPRDPQRLLEEVFDGSTPARTIDRDPELGFRLYARHFGLAVISEDGSRVACAPPDVSPWRWQRFLVGRVLPWAALLQGREVVHAGAVRVGNRIVAVVGPSGMGKSSLTLRLVLKGAGFVTDDALAISRADDGLRGHPGAGIVAIRPAEKATLGRSDLRRLGRVLGTSGKTYVALERESEPLPLGAIYFLAPPRATENPIEAGAEARQLLGSAFISSVTSPRRLAGLLDICADLARDTPLFQLAISPDTGADAAAELVLEHAAAAIEAGA